MTARSYLDAFDPNGSSEDVCGDCGLCLQQCPVLHMDEEESQAEWARVIRGEEANRVLEECTYCYSCNSICPHGLQPYALIMQRQSEQRYASAKGIPPYIQYLFTGHGDSSLFSDVYKLLPESEQAILDKWESPPARSREVLFVGCIGREIPHGIETSRTLGQLAKYGPRTACCGEIPFRLGDFERFSQTAERTFQLLKQLETKRLVCYCGSCSHSFQNIWKDYLQLELPFAVVSIWEWLWERVESGELKVQTEVKRKIAITDSCYSSELGDGFYRAIRGLHEAIGMEVIELENNRYDNLCCGAMCASKNDFDLMEPIKAAEIKIHQVRRTGVADLNCYCPGCLSQLHRPARDADIKVHYSLEEVLWALGDEPTTPLGKRMSLQGKLFMEKLRARG